MNIFMENEYYENLEEIEEFVERSQLAGELLDEIFEHDEITHEHSLNVACLALHVSGYAKLPKKDRRLLMIAGLYHDWGKTKIDKEIIGGEPGLRENLEAWEKIKKHPELSLESIDKLFEAKLLDGVEIKLIKGAVLLHHGFQGEKSYPFSIDSDEANKYFKKNNLNDKEIVRVKRLASVLAICDIYEAMTSNSRSYRKGNKEEAFEELKRLFGENKFIKYLI